jgi:hypothetical protein
VSSFLLRGWCRPHASAFFPCSRILLSFLVSIETKRSTGVHLKILDLFVNHGLITAGPSQQIQPWIYKHWWQWSEMQKR